MPSFSHHLFVTSLRSDGCNSSSNINAECGGRFTRFGVFGNKRTRRLTASRSMSRLHAWDNRERYGYQRPRTQLGRSNRKPIFTAEPPKTAPTPKSHANRRKSKSHKRNKSTAPRSTRRKKEKEKKNKNLKQRDKLPKMFRAENIAEGVARFEPKYEHFENVCEEPQSSFFASNRKTSKFFDKISAPPETVSVVHDEDTVGKFLNKCASEPTLLRQKRFITTNDDLLRFKSPTKKRAGLNLPKAKKNRILNHQRRIKEYVQKQETRNALKDTMNVESKKKLFNEYNKKIVAKRNYNVKSQMLSRRKAFGLNSPHNKLRPTRETLKISRKPFSLLTPTCTSLQRN